MPKPLDPEFIRDGCELTELYVKGGVRTFRDFVCALKSNIPESWEHFKDHLHLFWVHAGANGECNLEELKPSEAKQIIAEIDASSSAQPDLFRDDAPQSQNNKDIDPERIWDSNLAKHTLDELFVHTTNYKDTTNFKVLLKFVSHFRAYSPYNSMLIHIQLPGAHFVAPPHRWLFKYGHTIKTGARPIVILQPMGPVMFVFDVSDTVPMKDALPLPIEVTDPFQTDFICSLGIRDERLYQNAIRDGIKISTVQRGSQAAGSIQIASTSETMRFQDGFDKNDNPKYVQISVTYEMLFNDKLPKEAIYATVVHELAHLYCGHLGSPNVKHWPDRMSLSENICEFEAESVTHLVCSRAGLDPHSCHYLHGYLDKNGKVPDISIECIMKAAGLIESMSLQTLKPRPPIPERPRTP